MATLGEVIYEIKARNTQFKSTIKDSKEVIKGFTGYIDQSRNRVRAFNTTLNQGANALRGWGIAAGVAGAALTALGGSLTNTASDAVETQNKFNVVFRGMTKETNDWALGFAKAVGRSRTDVKAWAAELQDTFVPLGFAREEAAEMSKQIVELGVDVASFGNKVDSEVIRNFTSAMVGNHEAVRSYGISITEAEMRMEALRMGIVYNSTETDSYTKAQMRFNLMLRATVDAQGDAIRTAGEYANVKKRAAAEIRNLREYIGAGLIPIAAKLQLQIIRMVMTAQSWIRANAKTAAEIIVLVSVIAGLLTAFSILATGTIIIVKVITALSTVFMLLASKPVLALLAITALAVAYKKNFADMKNTVDAFWSKVSPIMDTLASWGGKVIATAWNWTIEALDTLGWLYDHFMPWLTGLPSSFDNFWNITVNGLKDLTRVAVYAVDKSVRWVVQIFSRVLSSFTNWVNKTIQWVVTIASRLISDFSEWVSKTIAWFVEVSADVKSEFGAWVAKTISWVVEVSSSIKSDFSAWVNKTISWVVEVATDIKSDFSAWVDSTIAWVVEITSDIKDTFTGWVGKTISWVVEVSSSLKSDFSNWVNKSLAWVVEVSSDLKSDFSNWVNKAINWVVEVAVDTKDDFSTWVTKSISWVVEIAADVTGDFSNWVNKTISWIVEITSTVVGDFSAWVDKTVSWVVEITANVIGDFKAWVSKTISWVVAITSNIKSDFSAWVGKTIDWVVAVTANIISDFSGWVSKTIAWTINLVENVLSPTMQKVINGVMDITARIVNVVTSGANSASEWLLRAMGSENNEPTELPVEFSPTVTEGSKSEWGTQIKNRVAGFIDSLSWVEIPKEEYDKLASEIRDNAAGALEGGFESLRFDSGKFFKKDTGKLELTFDASIKVLTGALAWVIGSAAVSFTQWAWAAIGAVNGVLAIATVLSVAAEIKDATETKDYEKLGANIVAALIAGLIAAGFSNPSVGLFVFNAVLQLELGMKGVESWRQSNQVLYDGAQEFSDFVDDYEIKWYQFWKLWEFHWPGQPEMPGFITTLRGWIDGIIELANKAVEALQRLAFWKKPEPEPVKQQETKTSEGSATAHKLPVVDTVSLGDVTDPDEIRRLTMEAIRNSVPVEGMSVDVPITEVIVDAEPVIEQIEEAEAEIERTLAELLDTLESHSTIDKLGTLLASVYRAEGGVNAEIPFGMTGFEEQGRTFSNRTNQARFNQLQGMFDFEEGSAEYYALAATASAEHYWRTFQRDFAQFRDMALSELSAEDQTAFIEHMGRGFSPPDINPNWFPNVTSFFLEIQADMERYGRDTIHHYMTGIEAGVVSATPGMRNLAHELHVPLIFDIKANDDMAMRWGLDMVSYFVKGAVAQAKVSVAAVQSAVDALLMPLTFDNPQNDAMAVRYGDDVISHFVGGIRNGAKRSVKTVQDAVDILLLPLDNIKSAANVHGKNTANDYSKGVETGLKGMLTNAKTWLAGLDTAMTKPIITAIDFLLSNIDTVEKALKDLDKAPEDLGLLGDELNALAKGLGEKTTGGKMLDLLGPVGKLLGSIDWGKVAGIVKDGFSRILGIMGIEAGKLGEHLKTAATGITDTLKRVLEPLLNVVKTLWDKLANSKLGQIGSAVGETIKGVLNTIAPGVGDFVLAIAQETKSFERVMEIFAGIIEKAVVLLDLLLEPLMPLIEVIAEVMHAFIEGLTPIIEVIVAVLTPVFDVLANVIKFTANTIIRVWNTLLDLISLIPFVDLRKHKVDLIGEGDRLPDKPKDDRKSTTAGNVITNVSGAMRDALLDALRPLRGLAQFTVYAERMVASMDTWPEHLQGILNVNLEIRDLLRDGLQLGNVGGLTVAGGTHIEVHIGEVNENYKMSAVFSDIEEVFGAKITMKERQTGRRGSR